ncbi:MAG: cell envelope integrity protein CreD [Bacteroidia bacterium]|nr:cell envelope integrity protein CreD [Bacteroidia bacterium]
MDTSPANRPLFDRFTDWVRRSVLLKLFSVAIVVLLLLIPTGLTLDLVRERLERRTEAVREVSSKWGSAQTLGGFVLSVPYQYTVPNGRAEGGRETVRRTLHLLPDSLALTATLVSQQRRRGIFRVPLYEVVLELQAQFDSLGARLPVLEDGAELRWADAYFETGVTDIRGITQASPLTVNGTARRFEPSLPAQEVFASGMHCPVAVAGGSAYTASFRLVVRGSEALFFLPYGRTTRLTLTGQGRGEAPSFQGAFLPEAYQLGDTSFTATWQVLDLNRDLPPSFVGTGVTESNYRTGADGRTEYSPEPVYAPKGDAYGFGVRLLAQVNPYSQSERSVKYAVLLIFLTFLTLFLSEVLARRRVHLVQYLLIGFTLAVFYVVLLALAEHIGFGWAYGLAGAVITLYVAGYARAAFGRTRLAAQLGGLLVLLYGFFYTLLQLEDYALLVGSLGLLVLVGALLYITRRVDWYRYGQDN